MATAAVTAAATGASASAGAGAVRELYDLLVDPASSGTAIAAYQLFARLRSAIATPADATTACFDVLTALRSTLAAAGRIGTGSGAGKSQPPLPPLFVSYACKLMQLAAGAVRHAVRRRSKRDATTAAAVTTPTSASASVAQVMSLLHAVLFTTFDEWMNSKAVSVAGSGYVTCDVLDCLTVACGLCSTARYDDADDSDGDADAEPDYADAKTAAATSDVSIRGVRFSILQSISDRFESIVALSGSPVRADELVASAALRFAVRFMNTTRALSSAVTSRAVPFSLTDVLHQSLAACRIVGAIPARSETGKADSKTASTATGATASATMRDGDANGAEDDCPFPSIPASQSVLARFGTPVSAAATAAPVVSSVLSTERRRHSFQLVMDSFYTIVSTVLDPKLTLQCSASNCKRLTAFLSVPANYAVLNSFDPSTAREFFDSFRADDDALIDILDLLLRWYGMLRRLAVVPQPKASVGAADAKLNRKARRAAAAASIASGAPLWAAFEQLTVQPTASVTTAAAPGSGNGVSKLWPLPPALCSTLAGLFFVSPPPPPLTATAAAATPFNPHALFAWLVGNSVLSYDHTVMLDFLLADHSSADDEDGDSAGDGDSAESEADADDAGSGDDADEKDGTASAAAALSVRSSFVAYLLRYLKLLRFEFTRFRAVCGAGDGDGDGDGDDGDTFEKCMSTLIRLSLAIQRLQQKGLFPYDATPLVRALTAIEELYEQSAAAASD